MSFNFSSKQLKRCTLVRLGGRLDGSNAPEVGNSLRKITDGENVPKEALRLVINMKDVTYTSNAVLAELIDIWKTCRRFNRGDMRLAEVNPNIKKVLDLTGLSGQFVICDTEGEAIGSF